MCDRTQEEVLARELAFQVYWEKGYRGEQLKAFMDSNWKDYTITSADILDTLESHKRKHPIK